MKVGNKWYLVLCLTYIHVVCAFLMVLVMRHISEPSSSGAVNVLYFMAAGQIGTLGIVHHLVKHVLGSVRDTPPPVPEPGTLTSAQAQSPR